MKGLSSENSTAFTSSSILAVVEAIKAGSAECMALAEGARRILAGQLGRLRRVKIPSVTAFGGNHAACRFYRRLCRSAHNRGCAVLPLRRHGRQEVLRPERAAG